MVRSDRLKRAFKLRFAILYPFGAYCLFFASPDDKSLRLAVWFILSGLFLRLWANGYAVKLDRLTTCGPYAFLRHPLYLGTALVVTGFAVMLKIPCFLGAACAVLLSIVYRRKIKEEEEQLRGKFGNDYKDYRRKVPLLIPTIFPYQDGTRWPFSFSRLMESREYKLFLWAIIAVIGFHLKEEFMIERETLELGYIALIVLMFALAAVDLGRRFVKIRGGRLGYSGIRL